jgi:hypothetical protein
MLSGKPTNPADLSELLDRIIDEFRKLLEEGRNRELKGEALVCLTVPKELLQEFQDDVVAPYYPQGDISEAVAGLMRAAVLKKQKKLKKVDR